MDEGKDCEVCGTDNSRIIAIVDGVKMRVCENCAKFGKVVEIEKEKSVGKKQLPGKIEVEEEIVEDYAERIKSARQKKGLSTTELAKLVAEKESFLKKVEAGEIPPTDKLADKLGKALSIKLYEIVEIAAPETPKSSKQGTTFGDLIEMKKKKK